MNYSLLAWGTQRNKIELLQKKAVRVFFFKSPITHTKTILKRMSLLKLTEMYICNFLKLYYKLPDYFNNFLPEYGIYRQSHPIRLPAIRCDVGEINSKYQNALY